MAWLVRVMIEGTVQGKCKESRADCLVVTSETNKRTTE